jgi:multicomponent K+:H+ antiporter subunit G
MPFWAEITVTVFLVIAGVFGLVGSYGLLRLPDPMTRIHAPTKATTLGVGGVLIASMVFGFAVTGELSTRELLVALFLFLTSPISALFIAKVHLHLRQNPETLPEPEPDTGWASYTAQGPSRGVRDIPPQPPSERVLPERSR